MAKNTAQFRVFPVLLVNIRLWLKTVKTGVHNKRKMMNGGLSGLSIEAIGQRMPSVEAKSFNDVIVLIQA